MVKFADSEIVQILPSYLKDSPEVQAISYAVHRQMEKYLDFCKNIGVYAMIDTVTDNVLDMLAVDLGTQYYDDTLDIDAKRKLIKGTLRWYTHAGTPAAVAELVAAIYGEGEVVEWFDYGDDPYYFKIVTNALLTPETDAELSEMIERVKNARSHLRKIEIHRTTELTEYPGLLAHPVYKPPVISEKLETSGAVQLTEYVAPFTLQVTHPAAVYDGYSETGSVEETVYVGAAERSSIHPAAVFDGYQETGATVSGEIYNIVAGISSTRQTPVSESLVETAAEATQVAAAGASADSTIYHSIIT